MRPWVWASCLPWMLLLTHIPGCVSLRGPGSMDGTVGGSLSVRCTYEQEHKNNSKFWCEFPCVTWLSKAVETSATQQEARRGRVTIRDDPANLTFTVTLENLTEADSGSYWCGVSQPRFNSDLLAWVVVSVFPAPHAASTTLGPHLEPAEPTWQEPPDLPPTNDPGASDRGSLLSNIHFRLLIFLKVPLLLGMMGAVLWVSWPRRGPRQADSAV